MSNGMRPRLLDLFCGAGGCARGYQRAGFHVTGVDMDEQTAYCGDEYVQEGALAYLERLLWNKAKGDSIPYEAIHASPPCQAYAGLSKGWHPDLVAPVRALLRQTELPYVIENIVGAPVENPIVLCGSMFGLNVRRHRLFESNVLLLAPTCQHGLQEEIRAYYGKKGWLIWTPAAANVQKHGRKPLLRGSVDQAPKDMGIDWMTWDELREAIPPAYTEHIGAQLREHVGVMAA